MGLKRTTPGLGSGPSTGADIFAAIAEGNAAADGPPPAAAAPEVDDLFGAAPDEGDDYGGAGDYDEFEPGDDAQGEPGGEGYERFRAQQATVSADVLTKFVDFAVSRGCAALSGDPASQYRMDADERAMFSEAAEAYLATVNFDVSPGQAFALVAVVIFAPKLYEAGDKYAKRRSIQRKFKRANPGAPIRVVATEPVGRDRGPRSAMNHPRRAPDGVPAAAPSAPPPPPAPKAPPSTAKPTGDGLADVLDREAERIGASGATFNGYDPDAEPLAPAKPRTDASGSQTWREVDVKTIIERNPLVDLGGRTNFEHTRSKRLYKYDTNGAYLKATQRTERAPKVVVDLWNEGLRSADILKYIKEARKAAGMHVGEYD